MANGPTAGRARGWGDQVLDILFTVFIIAIVFGVLLIAVTVTNNTLSQTTGANVNIGSSGQNAITVFGSLVGYLVTLSNFVGIIILLAIIVVVIGVLYYFFGNRGTSAFGGGL